MTVHLGSGVLKEAGDPFANRKPRKTTVWKARQQTWPDPPAKMEIGDVDPDCEKETNVRDATWVWLQIKQEGLRRFWSMLPLTRVPFTSFLSHSHRCHCESSSFPGLRGWPSTHEKKPVRNWIQFMCIGSHTPNKKKAGMTALKCTWIPF